MCSVLLDKYQTVSQRRYFSFISVLGRSFSFHFLDYMEDFRLVKFYLHGGCEICFNVVLIIILLITK